MADAQIAIIDGDQTQVVLAPGENPAIVTSIPGPQGPAGAGVPTGGATNEVLYKLSSTFGDTAWGPITSAMIGDLQIVNADVSASAAIAGTKISPNFGSQNVTTTGTSTAASFIPTSSTAPTNGLYLNAANSVALSTNGTQRLSINANGLLSTTAATAAVASFTGPANAYIDLTDGTGIFRTQLTSSTPFIGSASNHGLILTTNNTERLRITSAGLVGIGTSAPDSLFVAQVGSEGLDAITAQSLNQGGFIRLRPDGNNGNVIRFGGIAGNAGILRFLGPGDTERARIDGSGRVGIGSNATAPDTTLYVRNANSFEAQIKAVQTDSTGGVCAIRAQSSSALIDLMAGGSTYAVNYMGADEAGLITQTAGDSMRFNIGGSYCRWTFGSSEAVRLTSSGQLLVGTSSARPVGTNLNALVQIETTNYIGFSTVNNTADSGGTAIILAKSRGSAVGSSTIVQNGDNLGEILFAGADGTDVQTPGASILAQVDGTPGANDMPGRLVFSTTADGASSPTERMRITNGGRLEAWGGSTVNSFNLVTQAAAGTTYYLIYGGHSSSGAGNYGTQSFGVWSNGNVINTNNSYGAISDIKLKENIVDATSQWSDIKALQVRKYNFKEGQTHTQIGLIAQEVELVSPGLVSESPDRDEDGNDLGTVTKSVNYSVLYMKAVKALQEAMERIELLEARLDAANL